MVKDPFAVDTKKTPASEVKKEEDSSSLGRQKIDSYSGEMDLELRRDRRYSVGALISLMVVILAVIVAGVMFAFGAFDRQQNSDERLDTQNSLDQINNTVDSTIQGK
jgi:hypothetical protein